MLLNQKFFQNVLAQVSVFLHQKEMLCRDKELVSTSEEHYKVLQPMGYKLEYRDYITVIYV
jgi:hypothetical protein